MRDRDREFIRRYLGITKLLEEVAGLQTVPLQLQRMERKMATAKTQLDALSTKVDDLVADVRAALGALGADRENLSDDGQAALDQLSAKVDAFDAEIGDADGSDTAAPPVDETPVDDGSTTDTFR
jgi:DNA anti-recombination protein RmuC